MLDRPSRPRSRPGRTAPAHQGAGQVAIVARQAGIEVLARTTTFGEAAAVWLDRSMTADVPENTRANYERVPRVHVLPLLGSMRVPEIRGGHVVLARRGPRAERHGLTPKRLARCCEPRRTIASATC